MVLVALATASGTVFAQPAITGDPSRDGTVPPDSDENEDAASTEPCSCEDCDPVILHSGEFVLSALDLNIVGRGLAVEFRRYYRSQANFDGPLGHNWDHIYNRWVVRSNAQNLLLHDGRGLVLTYTHDGDGVYTRHLFGTYNRLTENPDGTFTVRESDGTESDYHALDGSRVAGRLTRMTDRNRNSLTFQYNGAGQLIRILDSLNRPIALVYDADGHLVELRDFSGRQSLFVYDNQGDLASVTQTAVNLAVEQARITRYGYLAGFADFRLNHNLARMAGPMASLADPDLINTYGTDSSSLAMDRIVSQELRNSTGSCCADPATTVFAYQAINPESHDGASVRTTLTDGRGQVTIYELNAAGGLLKEIEIATSTTERAQQSNRVTSYTVNRDGETTSVLYPAGNRLTRRFDENNPDRVQRGNLVQKEEVSQSGAERLVTTLVYEPVYNQVVREIDAAGNETGFGYDANGNLTVVTDTLNYTTTFVYDETGTQTGETDANGSTTVIETEMPPAPLSFLVNLPVIANMHAINLSSVHLPLLLKAAGAPNQSISAVAQPVESATPESEFAADGVTGLAREGAALLNTPQLPSAYRATPEEYLYSSVVTETDALGHSTVTVFDPYGNLLQKTDAAGNTTYYEYDVFDQLVAMTDALGNVTTYTYDGNGNRTTKTDANGHITTYAYDRRNQLRAVTDPLGYTTTYTYDENGNRATTTDANGNITRVEYDEFGQMVSIRDALDHLTQFIYDSNGNRVSVTDANGNVTLYAYDDLNRLVQISDPVGKHTGYGYDLLNRMITLTNSLGQVTTVSYDARNQLVAITDAAGNQTTRAYDPVGNQVASTDANGHTTTYTYDALGQLTAEIDPLGATTAYAYDAVGNPTLVTDPLGHTTRFTYDALQRLASIIDALGGQTLYTYDATGNRLSARNANGETTTYAYDANSQLTARTDPLGAVTGYGYDAVGNQAFVTDPLEHTTTYAYDALQRRVGDTGPLGQHTRYSYDNVGNRVSIVDANGVATYRTYDAANRLVATTDGRGAVTQFGYDAVGNRTVITDANGHSSALHYDSAGHLIALTNPLGDTTRYTYDGVGNTASKTTAQGQTLTYSYDAAGRLTTTSYPGGESVIRSYDAAGNLLHLQSTAANLEFAYDAFKRPVTIDDRILGKTIAFAYDAVGNRTSMSGPDGTITTYKYDATNRVTEIARDGNVATNTYDAAGRVTNRTLPHELAVDYIYDDADRLLGLTNRRADGAVLSGFSYALDGVGNPIAMTLTQIVTGNVPAVDVVAYGYDAAYQLVDETRRGNVAYTKQYVYDLVGNRTQLSVDGMVITYTYDAADRLLAERGARWVDYDWDANGNLVARSEGDAVITYTYDSEDRMVGLAAPGVTTMYAYDPYGRRVATVVNSAATRVLYEQPGLSANALAEYDGVGALTTLYLNGLRIDQNIAKTSGADTFVYLHDGLGSVRQLADASGAPVNRYDYDAFGNPQMVFETVPNQYTFTGRQRDEWSGLYYYRTRYYDAGLGRFTQQDRILAQRLVMGVSDLEPYTYVENHPTTYVDPSGQIRCQIAEECYQGLNDIISDIDESIAELKEQQEDCYTNFCEWALGEAIRGMELLRDYLDAEFQEVEAELGNWIDEELAEDDGEPDDEPDIWDWLNYFWEDPATEPGEDPEEVPAFPGKEPDAGEDGFDPIDPPDIWPWEDGDGVDPMDPPDIWPWEDYAGTAMVP